MCNKTLVDTSRSKQIDHDRLSLMKIDRFEFFLMNTGMVGIFFFFVPCLQVFDSFSFLLLIGHGNAFLSYLLLCALYPIGPKYMLVFFFFFFSADAILIIRQYSDMQSLRYKWNDLSQLFNYLSVTIRG